MRVRRHRRLQIIRATLHRVRLRSYPSPVVPLVLGPIRALLHPMALKRPQSRSDLAALHVLGPSLDLVHLSIHLVHRSFHMVQLCRLSTRPPQIPMCARLRMLFNVWRQNVVGATTRGRPFRVLSLCVHHHQTYRLSSSPPLHPVADKHPQSCLGLVALQMSARVRNPCGRLPRHPSTRWTPETRTLSGSRLLK